VEIIKIDRVKDFIERVGWTFVQAYLGLGLLDWLANGVNVSFVHQVYASLGAALVATIKVLIAQNFGAHPDGAAIPGGVIKTEKTSAGGKVLRDERGQVNVLLAVVLLVMLFALIGGAFWSPWMFILLVVVLVLFIR
jgi:hypothetical protein